MLVQNMHCSCNYLSSGNNIQCICLQGNTFQLLLRIPNQSYTKLKEMLFHAHVTSCVMFPAILIVKTQKDNIISYAVFGSVSKLLYTLGVTQGPFYTL